MKICTTTELYLFLLMCIMSILCLYCSPAEPSASELLARARVQIERANELFPIPYDNFGLTKSFQHTDGIELPYRLFEPKKENDTSYPMVLFLHGKDGTGNDNLQQFADLIVPPTVWAFPENQEKYPCYVLVPQGTETPSWPHVRIPALKALSDSIIAGNPIDLEQDLYQRAFHGEMDSVVDIDAFSDRWSAEDSWTGQRTIIRELISRDMEPTPRYTWYPDVKHNSWDGAYSDPKLLDWLFSQSKNN